MRVIKSDFADGETEATFTWGGKLRVQVDIKPRPKSREDLSLNMVTQVDVVTDDNVISLLGAAGWGALGGVLLGPLGLLGGLLLGGRKKQITCLIQLNDGRRLLCITTPGEFKRLYLIK